VVAAILMMNLLRQYSPFLVILIVFFNIFFAGFCIKNNEKKGARCVAISKIKQK